MKKSLKKNFQDRVEFIKNRSYGNTYTYPTVNSQILLAINKNYRLFAEEFFKYELLCYDNRVSIIKQIGAVIEDNTFMYLKQKNATLHMNRRKIKYDELFSCFDLTGYLQKTEFYFTINKEEQSIHVKPGKILDKNNNLLACIVVDNVGLRPFKESDISICVNPIFMTAPIYKNIYKNFIDYIVEPYIVDSEVDLIVTDLRKVENSIYRNNYEFDLQSSGLDNLITFVNENANNYLKL